MKKLAVLMALVAAAVLALGVSAQATTYNWNHPDRNGSTGRWYWDNSPGSQDNWGTGAGGTYPNAIGDVANFQRNIWNNNSQPITIDRSITVGTILVGQTNTTNEYMEFYASGSGRLTMDDTDGTAEISKNNNAGGGQMRFNVAITLNDDLVVANGTAGGGNEALKLYGNISESGGSKSITKNGVGLVVLGGNNTYTGDTIVNEGKLVLHHRQALQNSVLDLGAAGTLETWDSNAWTFELGGLKGEGEILTRNDTFEVGGISPGSSVGQLTLVDADAGKVGTLDISPIVDDGSLLFELGADTTAGVSYDHVSMADDALNIGTLNFADFTFSAETGFGGGIYTLFDAGGITGSLGTADGMIDGLASTLSISDNDVLLTVTAASSTGVIPEPSTFAIWALGLLALGLYARRRRRR